MSTKYSYDRQATVEAAGSVKIDPQVGSAIQHAIRFLHDAEGLAKDPQAMHGMPAEQQLANVLVSTIEVLQRAMKKLPSPH